PAPRVAARVVTPRPHPGARPAPAPLPSHEPRVSPARARGEERPRPSRDAVRSLPPRGTRRMSASAPPRPNRALPPPGRVEPPRTPSLGLQQLTQAAAGAVEECLHRPQRRLQHGRDLIVAHLFHIAKQYCRPIRLREGQYRALDLLVAQVLLEPLPGI